MLKKVLAMRAILWDSLGMENKPMEPDMKTITQRAQALKNEALNLNVFDMCIFARRDQLNALSNKYGFKSAVITNYEQKHIGLTTSRCFLVV